MSHVHQGMKRKLRAILGVEFSELDIRKIVKIWKRELFHEEFSGL